MDSISFDSMAAVYDETRALDEKSLNGALDLITTRFPPSQYQKLFEPGIGTGRIGIPLAERGYKVTGVDISENMLQVLQEKLARRPKALPVAFQKADITALPFKDAVYDISVATHVFHLIRHWKLAMSETLRVLKPKAPLVLMFTGAGMEAPDIRDRYRALAAGYGYTAKPIGMNTKTDLGDYLDSIGRHAEWVRDGWQWTQHVRLDKALADVKSKSYSDSKHVPDDVHTKVMEKIELELKKQYKDPAVEIEIPIHIDIAFILAD
ncbi:MAG: class I SAM-dependent methyltransferase [Dehalococcoidales bacterium]